jgi:hypothetical protein
VGDAKRLIVKPIAAKDANAIVKRLHYSGKVVQNSQLHLGVFLDGKCGGAMQFGPSLDKRKIQGLVRGTLWNEFIELNRMAFADWLPPMGESRCIAYAMRWMRKTYPQIKWVISFADGTQCGDGTIYRASGFVLTGIKENSDCMLTERSGVVHTMTVKSSERLMSKHGNWKVAMEAQHGKFKPMAGYQLRYIYFIDSTARQRLTVPILPFSEIQNRGAGMYRGKPRVRSADSGTPEIQSGGGGANPTRTLSEQEAAS